jgi:hypothetical protein
MQHAHEHQQYQQNGVPQALDPLPELLRRYSAVSCDSSEPSPAHIEYQWNLQRRLSTKPDELEEFAESVMEKYLLFCENPERLDTKGRLELFEELVALQATCGESGNLSALSQSLVRRTSMDPTAACLANLNAMTLSSPEVVVPQPTASSDAVPYPANMQFHAYPPQSQ